eukprot:15433826-Alexandrium_andersonii.AAC.1
MAHWMVHRRRPVDRVNTSRILQKFLEVTVEGDELLSLPLLGIDEADLHLCTEPPVARCQCLHVQTFMLLCKSIDSDNPWESVVDGLRDLVRSPCEVLNLHLGHICDILAGHIERDPARWGTTDLLKVASLSQMGPNGKKRRRTDAQVKQLACEASSASSSRGPAQTLKASGELTASCHRAWKEQHTVSYTHLRAHETSAHL